VRDKEKAKIWAEGRGRGLVEVLGDLKASVSAPSVGTVSLTSEAFRVSRKCAQSVVQRLFVNNNRVEEVEYAARR
jgi:hypothetical protein